MSELPWTDEQHRKIEETIAEETEGSRLVHKIIPDFNVGENARTVSKDRYNYETKTVDDKGQWDVEEASEEVKLTKLQVQDSSLSSAHVAVRRATQRLARRHDERVLAKLFELVAAKQDDGKSHHDVIVCVTPDGDGLIAATADAVAKLDEKGYRTGLVMVAGQKAYAALHTRVAGAADLPVKAVQGLLEAGPIHRSGVLPQNAILILAVGNGHIDRAVAVAPKIEWLRNENDGARTLRVYERFTPRFKETLSVVAMLLKK